MPSMDIYEDKTHDIAMEFDNITLVDIAVQQSFHATVKP